MSSYNFIKDGETLRDFLNNVITETFNSRRNLTEEKDKSALSSGDITADDVIEKLNIIRSGRSFKDEDVTKGMQDYLNGLSSPEKTALLSFLKGISEIVTAGVAGKEAFEPTDNPAGVKMEKTPSHQRVSVKPNIIKKPSASRNVEKVEDTTPPLPIEPKKK